MRWIREYEIYEHDTIMFVLELNITCEISNWVLKKVKCVRGYDVIWAWYA